MAQFNLDDLNKFNRSKILSVFGYTRESKQNLFGATTNPYYDIPELINFLIIYYYHFVETLRANNDKPKISDNNCMFTFIPTFNPGSVLGTVDIKHDDNCLYIWTLKLFDKWTGDIFIGILDASVQLESDKSFEDLGIGDKKFYACCGSWKESHNMSAKDVNNCDWNNCNAKVKMEMNTEDKTLRYFIDGRDHQEIGFDDIDFSNDTVYHFAISCSYYRGAINDWSDDFLDDHKSFKLIDFQQRFRS